MIDLRDEDGVRILRIQRPPVNALGAEDLERLREEIDRGAADGDVRGIVIAGSDAAFSVGLDLKLLLGADEALARRTFCALDEALRSIALCSVPIAAALTGHCLGGGLAVAALAGRRMARPGDFRIGFTEARAGIVLSPKMVAAVARLVGDEAHELCASAKILSPAEAQALGLVDEITSRPVDDAARWCRSQGAVSDGDNRPEWAKPFVELDHARIEARVAGFMEASTQQKLSRLLRTGA